MKEIKKGNLHILVLLKSGCLASVIPSDTYGLSHMVSLKYFIFFSARERAISSESCNLIGSGSGQNFPVSDHGHGNRGKTIK